MGVGVDVVLVLHVRYIRVCCLCGRDGGGGESAIDRNFIDRRITFESNPIILALRNPSDRHFPPNTPR